jgi:type I restriction enzyme S subunit
MAVKKGYKQTEVGAIPEDWDVKMLKDISPSQSVGLVINPSTYYNPSGTVPLLVGSNVKENSIDWESANKITEEGNKRIPASQLFAGDLVMVRVGDPGVTAVVPSELEGANCASMMIIRRSQRFNSTWLCWMLNSKLGRIQVENVQYGTAQKQFNISDAINFKVPVPSLGEQEAIANALSDADAWIESLEQLIAKRRQIKQGAMQELLTGKRRLPGFSGEWTKSTLGELGRWSGGMTPSMANTKYWEGGDFPWVSSGDVKSAKLGDTTQHITMTAIRESATTVMPARSIIIVNRSGILRRYLPVSLLMREMAINQDIKGLILKPGLTSEFVLYCILNAGPEILASCLKAGTTVESIELMWLKRFAILLPNLEEQTAIAAVLSDMDTEIESLESKLAKAREIKQGMMKELLTGRIRLV